MKSWQDFSPGILRSWITKGKHACSSFFQVSDGMLAICWGHLFRMKPQSQDQLMRDLAGNKFFSIRKWNKQTCYVNNRKIMNSRGSSTLLLDSAFYLTRSLGGHLCFDHQWVYHVLQLWSSSPSSSPRCLSLPIVNAIISASLLSSSWAYLLLSQHWLNSTILYSQ